MGCADVQLGHVVSDWKKSAAARRDARHGGPVAEGRPARAKKDRKRWCRGKTGVEHKPEPRKYDDVKGIMTVGTKRVERPRWWLLVCSECGKELDRYWPMSFAIVGGGRTEEQAKPAWVPKENRRPKAESREPS
jgi:hypothetical protein